MRKIIIGLLAVGFVSTGAWMGCSQAADEAAPAATPAAPAAPAATPAAPAAGGEAAAPAAGGAAAGGPMLEPATPPPLELVASTPKGELKNPYNGDYRPPSRMRGGSPQIPLRRLQWLPWRRRRRRHVPAAHQRHLGLWRGRRHAIPPHHPRHRWPDQGGVYAPQARGRGRADATLRQIIKTSDDLWRIIAFIRSVNPNSMKLVDVPYAPNPY